MLFIQLLRNEGIIILCYCVHVDLGLFVGMKRSQKFINISDTSG